MQTFPKQQIAEWKAFTSFFEFLQEKIQDLKNGNFQQV